MNALFAGTGCLFVIVISIVLAGVQAGILMLLIGALHSFWPEVPPLGFLPVFLIMVIFNILFGGRRSG